MMIGRSTSDYLWYAIANERYMQTNESAADARFIRETGVAGALAELAEPILDDLGFRLVRVKVMGRDPKTIQVMAERADGTMTVGDCEKVSKQLSPVLDVHDLIAGNYNLEVSSPGIDRPLVRPSDFTNWAGYDAKLETHELVDGRKRFRGHLLGFADGEVRLEVDLPEVGQTELGFPVGLVAEAHLVLTDELIRESLRRGKQNGKADVAADDAIDVNETEDD